MPKSRASSPNAPGTASETISIAPIAASSTIRARPSSVPAVLPSQAYETQACHSTAMSARPCDQAVPGRVARHERAHLRDREDEDEVEEELERGDPLLSRFGAAALILRRMQGPLDIAELRAAYDAELRARIPDRLAPGVIVERDGPLVRFTGFHHGGFVGYRELGGLDGRELDELIARQRDHFAARGEQVEWKLHGHDLPADLADHLTAAGFEPEELETVVIGTVASVASEPRPPEGVTLREVRRAPRLERLDGLQELVWGAPAPGYSTTSSTELVADPGGVVMVFAEAGDQLVCAGRVVFERGTSFATLWGGGTHPDWRGRGVYRSLVAYRAQLAAARGYTLSRSTPRTTAARSSSGWPSSP